MWSGFQAKKFNTRRELELDYAKNQAEPENQAGLVPGPEPDPEENFFSKNQIRHYALSPRERTAWFINICPKKGRITFDTNRVTPCMSSIEL